MATSKSDQHGTTANPMLAASHDAEHDIWIINRWLDLLLFVATPLVLIPLVILLEGRLAVAGLYLAVLTFGSVGHHLPGFLRVYGDRDLLRRYRQRFLLAPPVMLVIGLTFAYAGWSGLSVILLLWGFWHVMMQEYGFARIYDAKVESFARQTIYLDFLMCFCWFGAGIVFSPLRLEQLLQSFYTAGGPLIEPTWIQSLQLLWVAVTAIVTMGFLMNYIYQRRQGQAASLVKLLTVAASVGLWWYAMVKVEDMLLGILLFEVFHGIQYLALARFYMSQRLVQGADISPWGRVLFRRGMLYLAVYLALAGLYGLPAYLGQITPLWVEYTDASNLLWKTLYGLVAASTMLHFYYDGFVWQLRDATVRRGLDVADAPAETGDAWALGARVPHLLKWSVLIIPLALLGARQWQSDGPTPGALVNLAESVPGSWHAQAELGAALLAVGEPAKAAEILLRATDLRPDAAGPVCDLGRALRQLGRLDEAVAQFERAVELEPNSGAFVSELGKTLFGLGEQSKGMTYLQAARDLAPQDAAIAYDLGMALIGRGEEGDLPAALLQINASLALDPTRAEAYNARGNIYWNEQEIERALADFDEAIRLDPQLAKAYRNRAGVWSQQGNLEKTLENLNQAIEADGTKSRDYVWRGRVYNSLKQYDKARDSFMEGIRREATYIEPLESLVELLINCPDESFRDSEQAIALAQAACQQTGWSDARALQLLASTYAATGDYHQAVRWQQQAVECARPDTKASLQKQLEEFQQLKDGAQGGLPADAPPGTAPAGEGAPQPDAPTTLQPSETAAEPSKQ